MTAAITAVTILCTGAIVLFTFCLFCACVLSSRISRDE